MVTVRLVGGLANQMQQYAFGRALSLKRNEELYLDTDPFYYDIREYELGIFTINEHIATSKNKPRYLKLRKNKILDKFRYIVAWVMKKLNPNHILENPRHPKVYAGMYDFQPITLSKALNAKGDIYVEGFWHSEKYIKGYEDIIRKDFTLKTPISDETNLAAMAKMEHCNSVSIHVRKGDYAGTHYEGICGPEYYQRAIYYIQKHIQNPKFFVFSDDIDWCKENFKQYEIEEFIENGGNARKKNLKQVSTSKHGADAYKKMILIWHCKHNIICNSSFSRRGARLNPNPDKIVVAPTRRHANINYADFIPDGWVKL